MPLTAVIALKLTDELPEIEADWIGADKGALVLARKNVRMKLAIGDFDSVEEEDIAVVREYADEVIRLNPIKDDSDSEAALNVAFERGYEQIWMTGALGGRFDHEYVNMKLALRYPGKVILFDGRNRIMALGEGVHEISKDDYAYISFFAQPEAEISLKGFFYPLDHRTITENDLYTLSNEITAEKGIVEIHRGTVLLVQCRD